jgi:hypothetical protein
MALKKAIRNSFHVKLFSALLRETAQQPGCGLPEYGRPLFYP